jgi:hypothetical protein
MNAASASLYPAATERMLRAAMCELRDVEQAHQIPEATSTRSEARNTGRQPMATHNGMSRRFPIIMNRVGYLVGEKVGDPGLVFGRIHRPHLGYDGAQAGGAEDRDGRL